MLPAHKRVVKIANYIVFKSTVVDVLHFNTPTLVAGMQLSNLDF
jgi:hypothetical protein